MILTTKNGVSLGCIDGKKNQKQRIANMKQEPSTKTIIKQYEYTLEND